MSATLDAATYAAQSAIDAALSGLTQHDRLLRLTTPLGANVLLAERLTGTEAVAPTANGMGGFKFELLAVATDARIDLRAMLGQPVLLELLTTAGVSALRPFHAHITAAALIGSDGGIARYRLTLEPWLAFLGHRQDSYIFQHQSVPEIIDELLGDWSGQGALVPAWRWELSDPSVYPKCSLTTQFDETDLAFIERLMLEEGLFYWFEHAADKHTLVIADHNPAMADGAQASIRFTGSASASFEADSLTQWHSRQSGGTHNVALASWDYRQRGLRPAQASSAGKLSGIELTRTDVPGAYSHEDTAQAERLAQRQLEAIAAEQQLCGGVSQVRGLSAGSTVAFAELPATVTSTAGSPRFAITAVRHTARNNLRADAVAYLERMSGSSIHPTARTALATDPLYTNHFQALPEGVAFRASTLDVRGKTLHPKPSTHGTQTAIVVGITGNPVHTDRDHRIKLQFHWQRGANASHRLDHPGAATSTPNAPANEASGTWVRVAAQSAGANWGSAFVPRLGQEVLVDFVEGDIDRPVVIASLYNGVGQTDAQGNRIGAGAASATGNAPAWFPGGEEHKSGQTSPGTSSLEHHAHRAVYAGFKTQELTTSQSGQGGYNQLLIDLTPNQPRLSVATTMAASALNLGALRHQNDNQRLQATGHGLELTTQAQGALRAGSGLLISTERQGGSTGGGTQLDARVAQSQLEQAQQLNATLTESAQKHNAKLSGEPEPKKLPIYLAQQAELDSLKATDQRSAAESGSTGSNAIAIGGGSGTVPAWSRPSLLLDGAQGIAALTPAHLVASAGQHLSFTAGQDINLLAQRQTSVAVKSGVVLYTYGQNADASRPVAQTGIQLHAASGNVVAQAQSGKVALTAQKRIDIASTTADVKMTAPEHLLMTSGGSYIRLEGGNIEIGTSGNADFWASSKVLTGPQSAQSDLQLSKAAPLERFNEAFVVKNEETGTALAHVHYRIEDAQGNLMVQGVTDQLGQTQRVHTGAAEQIKVFVLDN